MRGEPLWQLYQIAAATGGSLVGESAGPSAAGIYGLSNDTRTLEPGDLFVALEAARDGHDFLKAAFDAGAAAALVSRADTSLGPQIVVQDTLSALEHLAAAARDRFFGYIIGVTGSVGKTTTKEMLRHALKPLGEIHAAEQSFNNHIGVPMTLAELPPTADVAVMEMGMNHSGEIRGLTTLAKPHIAIITAIAEAHLENLGSIEAIADAKAEIAEGLLPGGSIILPADSPHLGRLRQRCSEVGVNNVRTFGEKGADASILSAESDGSKIAVRADVLGREVSWTLGHSGLHLVSNSLAALLAAALAGAEPKDAAASLDHFVPGEGRGSSFAFAVDGKTIKVIDESYNANPASMRAAFAVLGQASGRRVAVLGDMRELGPDSEALHAELAPDLQKACDRVHTAGSDIQQLRLALPQSVRGLHVAQGDELLQPLLDDIQDGDTLLFKGSKASNIGGLLSQFLKMGQRL
ncbi:MAG: UDP-N-acetylmuramoyl-tripeptide--D-alanyl-D-alanine ligase [Pseudomonadota bacterium]